MMSKEDLKRVYLDTDMIPFVIFDLNRLISLADNIDGITKLPDGLATDIEYLHFADEKWEQYREYVEAQIAAVMEYEGRDAIVWICPHCGGTQYNVFGREEPECDHACIKPVEWKDVYAITLEKERANATVPWNDMIKD
jgi:hypothetical protein